MNPAISRFKRARIWLIAAGVAALIVLLFVLARSKGREPAELVRRSWTERSVAKPNIVLITLDTTRADHLGVYGYSNARTPAVDALARQGVLFTQAASPAPLTLPAHSSLMTGLYPTYHGVRLNGNAALGQEQTTLAEVLSRNGYQTAAFIGAFVLDGRWGLNQGFGVYDDQFDLRKFAHLDLAAVQRPGDQVMDAALRWLEYKKDGPFFAWVHLYDAHSPYEPPEPLLSEFRGQGLAGLYDGEIAFADRQVARCMSWLQKAGLDQKSVVVIAGDHGESLGSHGEGTHGFFVYDYAVHVPLIVAAPIEELRGVRIESQVSLVDIFPTVLALAGINSASKVHGRSLLPLMLQSKADAKDETVYAYAESMSPSLQYGWSPLHSLRSPRFKFIQAPRPELYDLADDPDETKNVFDTHRKLGRDMAQALERLMTDTSRGAPTPEAANLDRETMARLASLGYVSSPTPAKKAGSSPLADPKDKLTVFAAVQRAGELMVQDEHASAAQALESALAEEPTMPQARLMLGTCYAELGRGKDARVQFDAVLKDDPQSVQALLGMANILLADAQIQDVITLCKRTLSLDDRNTQAYALLGDAYIAKREPSKALPYLEKAVEIQPKMSQNRLNLAACLIEVKQLARAQTTLEEIIAEHPKFPGAQFNLGVLYEELGRTEQARAAYATEVANYPHSFKARFNLGKVLSRLEDWRGSIEQMREVIRIAPKQPEGYLFLARSLLHEAAPLDEVQRLAEQGLSVAKTPDLKALGWFLMADVFSRRHEPENMNRALRNARLQVSASARGSSSSSTSP